MAAPLKELWTGAEWRAEAEAWIKDVLTDRGLTQVGPIEQPRVRIWSTQLTVPTDQGKLWFKENNPGQSFEAAVVAVLADITPGHVVIPVAVDPARGWLLSPDHGPTLSSRDSTDHHVWARVVTDFADLQQRATPHGDRLTAAGLPPLPPSAVSAYLDEQLERLTLLPPGDPRHVDPELSSQVRACLPRIAVLADQLSAGPIAMTLEHNDLHHNNAFLPSSDTEPLRFFDFGDALWAHPFTSLRITLNVVTGEWETDLDDPRIRYIIDAYLDCWSDAGSRAELRQLLDAALALGPAHRFVSWQRIMPYAGPEDLAEFGSALPGWLRILAEQFLPAR